MKNTYMSSTLAWHYSIDKIIELAYQNRLCGIELWAEQAWFQKIETESIKLAKKKYDIKIFCHAPSWDLNLCALNEGIRKQSIEEIKKSIRLNKDIDGEELTVHPGHETLSGKFTKLHFNKLLESLQEICSYAESHQTNISIELMESVPKEFVTHYQVMNDLLAHLPNHVTVTLDIAHMNHTEDLLMLLTNLKKIGKVHISNRTRDRYHVPLGQGYLDCQTILKTLSEKEFPLIIEGFDESKELLILNENLNFIKNL